MWEGLPVASTTQCGLAPGRVTFSVATLSAASSCLNIWIIHRSQTPVKHAVDIAFSVGLVSLTWRARGQHSSSALKALTIMVHTDLHLCGWSAVRFDLCNWSWLSSAYGFSIRWWLHVCWAVENVKLASTRTHSDRQNVFKVVKHMILAMDQKDSPPPCGAETLHAGVGLGSFQSTTVISFWLNEHIIRAQCRKLLCKYRFLSESKGCTAESLARARSARARDDGCTSRRWGSGTAFSHALTHQD